MKRKKVLQKLMAMGMSLIMAVSVAACGSAADTTKEAESAPSAEKSSETKAEDTKTAETETETAESEAEGEPVEISIAIWGAGEFLVGDEVQTGIEEKLNIKLTPVHVTWDDYTQKNQLWAASESLPDIFIDCFRTRSSYPEFISQGLLKEIPENLDAYPNLKEYLSGEAAQNAKLNGKLYCLPRQTYPSQEWTVVDRTIIYRWDLAQKAGWEKEPENWDEFQQMMKDIMAADPDGTGIGGMTADGKATLGGTIMPYASPYACENGMVFKWIMGEDGNWIPAYFTEDTLAGFQLARDMYDSGVIDKDIALVSGSTGVEKFLQGKSAAVAVCGGFHASFSSMGRYWKEVHGTEYLDDVRALDVMPDVNGNPSYAVWDYAWSESYINANVDDVKLDKILQLWDYLLSEEGSYVSLYGPEGELWDMVDGKVVMHDDGVVVSDIYPSTGALGVLARWNPNAYDDRFVTTDPVDYYAIDLERVEQASAVKLPEYNQRCTELVMELDINFAVSFDEDFLALMTGEAPVEDMWAELCAQYEQDGLSDMIKQVNEALVEE